MSEPPVVTIEKLVPGGDGLGHVEGSVVFVPLTAPGDVVSLKNVQKRRGVLFAQVDEILNRSPDRVEPPCPWFGECGGCKWMHLKYEAQLKWKEDTFRQAMSRIGRLDELPPIKIHPAPSEFKYRHRARLHIKGTDLGFHQRATNRIVSWDRCMLLPEILDLAVADIRAWFRQRRAPSVLKAFEIALDPVGDQLTLSWIFSASRNSAAAARAIMDSMEKVSFPDGVTLAGQVARNERGKTLAGSGGGLAMDVAGSRILASPGTFFQVNPHVNAVLVDRVLTHLEAAGTGSLLDLYCGNGNFSLPAAAAGIRTVGVESSRGAVRDARAAAGSAARFVQMDVVRFLARGYEEPDAVIIDPPRTGLPAEAATILGAGGTGCIIYVSCEPSTLARDIGRLIQAGYDVTDVELLDMFPQTSHMETLVVMKRPGTYDP